MLLDGWVIEIYMLSLKAENQANYFLFYKSLSANFGWYQKAELHSEPCQTSKKEFFKRAYLVFVTISQEEVFSRNIMLSVAVFN